MAKEITITIKQLVKNGNYNPGELSDVAAQFDQAASGGASGTLLVTTAAEVELLTPGLTNRGILWLKNLDDVNFIQWGFATGVYGGRLNPTEPNQFRSLAAAQLFLRADTADCQLQYRWLEA